MTVTGDETEAGSASASCRVRMVLDRIGDKWAIYVVDRLGAGPRRFSELNRGIDGITARMLTVMLRGLERDGILTRTVHAAVPQRVAGPCLLNVVRGGKTPEIDLRRAQQMGYRLAIVPGLLLKAVIGACDEMLAELKANLVHPVPRTDMTVREAFNRVGADEWDALRTRFRDSPERRAAE